MKWFFEIPLRRSTKFLFLIKYLPALTSLSVISCLLILPSCIRSFSGTVYLLLQKTLAVFIPCANSFVPSPALRSSSVNWLWIRCSNKNNERDRNCLLWKIAWTTHAHNSARGRFACKHCISMVCRGNLFSLRLYHTVLIYLCQSLNTTVSTQPLLWITTLRHVCARTKCEI